MSKRKTVIIAFAASYIFICISLLIYKTIDPVYLLPEPWLGRGIYKLMGNGKGTGLVWSPNGQYLAGLTVQHPPMPDFPCFRCNPYSEIYVIDLSKMEKRVISRSDDNIKFGLAISWFPDSEHIAYSDKESVIRSIDVDGKNDVQFMAESGYPLWKPDGSMIATRDSIKIVGNWFSAIYLIDLQTGRKELVFQSKDSSAYVSSLSWSADGGILAFVYGSGRADTTLKRNVYFYYLETKRLVQFTSGQNEYQSVSFSPAGRLIALEQVRDEETPYYQQRLTIIRDLVNGCEVKLPIPYTHWTSWSPDSQRLFVSGDEGAYIVNLTEFFGEKFTQTGSICP